MATTVKTITIKRVLDQSVGLPANNTTTNQITVDEVYDNLSSNDSFSYVMWAGNTSRAFDTLGEFVGYIGTEHFWGGCSGGYVLYAGNDERMFADIPGLSAFILSSTFWG